MRLEILDHHLEDIQWGERTLLSGGTLLLNPADIQNEIKDLLHNLAVRLELARPGESKRIVHVLDTIHPLEKIASAAHAFPGIDQAAALVGTGRTARLGNMLVTLTGLFPHQELMTPLERPREGIIDMSGAGAAYSYGSDLFHLVLTLEPSPSLSNIAFDQLARSIGIRVARRLALIEKVNAEPEQHISEFLTPEKTLPRVVLIYQIQSQIPFVRTFYYGEEISRTLPGLVHPNEFYDGAIVSGNYKSERKIPTSLHCANSYIHELAGRHGKEVEFLGVILSKGYNDSFEQKKKMGLWSARLARNLGADGAVAIMEGTGNTTVDFMQTVKACEEEGVKTVAVLHEDNGPKGYERPLVDHPAEADAMISRGNRSEKFLLRPLNTVIGGNTIDLHLKATQDARAAFLFDPTIYFASHCRMGISRLRAAYES
jgi:glycine reductase